jgi:N-methylhydantoinase B
MERTRFEPWGLGGGSASNRTWAALNPGSEAEARELGRIGVLHLDPGNVVSIVGAGGAGFGDPFERDPELVFADLRAGLLSAGSAAGTYGVIVDSGGADLTATAKYRTVLRGGRATPPALDRGPSRSAYEELWTDEASELLARLLLELPHGLRAYGKQEVHRRVAHDPPGTLNEGRIVSALREILSRLHAAE